MIDFCMFCYFYTKLKKRDRTNYLAFYEQNSTTINCFFYVRNYITALLKSEVKIICNTLYPLAKIAN